MSTPEHYDLLVIGSGEAGKYLAWTFRVSRHSHEWFHRFLSQVVHGAR